MIRGAYINGPLAESIPLSYIVGDRKPPTARAGGGFQTISRLSLQTELVNQLSVGLSVGALEVLEMLATIRNHLQETAA